MNSTKPLHFDLVAAAHATMIEHGFQPDFPTGTDAEVAAIQAHPELPDAAGAQDLRNLLWSSIDNDTSKDLDQIEWAEQLPDGRIRILIGVTDGKAYRALVRNQAQLAYNAVGGWLEGKGAAPAKVGANADLQAQLKLQDTAAQHMLGSRFQHGALDLETIETQPVMQDEQAVDIKRQQKNRATSLIEEFMVAANGVIAK